jgi:hypothetical protein
VKSVINNNAEELAVYDALIDCSAVPAIQLNSLCPRILVLSEVSELEL